MNKNIVLSAGGVILNEKGEVCIVKQKSLIPWSLPKGHVEEGEGLEQAARREIFEETGISDLELIKAFLPYERAVTSKPGGRDFEKTKRLHFFLFKTKHTELRPNDTDNPEAIWVKKEEVLGYLTHEKDKEFFESILEEIK